MKALIISTICFFSFISSHAQQFKQLVQDSSKVDSLISLGLKNFNSKPILAEELFTKALLLSKTINYKRGTARSYHLTAELIMRQGKLDSAMVLLSFSQSIYLKMQDSTGLAKVLISQGDDFLRKGDHIETLKAYTEALSITDNTHDQETSITILRRMGNFLWKIDQYKESQKYLSKGLVIANALNDTLNRTRFHIAMGNLYNKTEQLDLAKLYFDSALSQHKFISYRQEVAIYNSLGIVNYQSGNYQNALDFHLKAKSMRAQLLDSIGLANSFNNLGNTYLKLNNLQKAEHAYLKFLDLGKSIKAQYLIRTALLNLSRLYEQKGAFKQAFYFNNQYDSLEDYLLNVEKNKQLIEIKEKYEAEKREKDIIILEQKHQFQQEKIINQAYQRNYLIVLSLLLVLLSSIVLWAYRQKKTSNKKLLHQNTIIKKREKEKELLLHEVNHRVKNNLQMVSSLLRLQSSELKDVKAQAVINEGQARVQALTLVHKKLYQSTSTTHIPLKEYITDLHQHIIYGLATDIKSELNVPNLMLDVDLAIPLALITNELITNAIKYAYTNQKNRLLKISLIQSAAILELNISDNGNTPLTDKEIRQHESFGLKLVYSLADQLKGQITLNNQNGNHWKLSFPY